MNYSSLHITDTTILEPEMERAKEAAKGIAQTMRDVISYALYPQIGLEFLKRKYAVGN